MDALTILNELRQVTVQKQNILNQYRKALPPQLANLLLKQNNPSQSLTSEQYQQKLRAKNNIKQSIFVLQSALQTLRSEEGILRDKKNNLQSERMNLFLGNKKLESEALELREASSVLVEKMNKKVCRATGEKQNQNAHPATQNINSILEKIQEENKEKYNEINKLEQTIYSEKKATHEAYSRYQELMLAIQQQKKNIDQSKKQIACLDWKALSAVEERNRLKRRQKQVGEQMDEVASWKNKVQKMQEVKQVLTETLEKWVQSSEDYLQGYERAKKIVSD